MTLEAHVPATLAFDADGRLANAILRTIQYADLFGQAMSADEVLRYLDIAADAESVRRVLVDNRGHDWLCQDGLYSLPDRAGIFERTQARARVAKRAWDHARPWAAVMAHIPFVRMIGVTGSLAMNNMTPDADMDYFVVTAPGRVWSTRFWLVAVVRLARALGQELCPNYVLSESALQFTDRTLFIARELAQMVPLFGATCYREMWQANQWAREFLPLADAHPQSAYVLKLSGLGRIIKTALEALLGTKVFDGFERWEMRRKIARLSKLPGAVPPHVILNAEQCKGHFRATSRSRADQFGQAVKRKASD